MKSKLCYVFFSLCMLLGFSSAASAADPLPGLADKWVYYKSENFELYSGGFESESRELLRGLELIRAVFLNFMKLKETRPVPVIVFYFAKEKTFRAYCPPDYPKNHNFAGLFMSGRERSIMMLKPVDDSDDAKKIIYAGYIHHLISSCEKDLPMWQRTGLGQLYATINETSDNVEIAKTYEYHVWYLNEYGLMPLDAFFTYTHAEKRKGGEKARDFAAQAWLLTHYLFRSDDDIPRDKKLLFFEASAAPRLRDNPEAIEALCKKILGIDFRNLREHLIDYYRMGKYTYYALDLPNIPARKTYLKRPVFEEEMQHRLAELTFRMGRGPDHANLILNEAAEKFPKDARIQEVLGSIAAANRDDELAEKHWKNAIDLGSENPAIIQELLELRANLVFAKFSAHYIMPEEANSFMRSLALRSIEAIPDQKNAYELLAWIEATAPKPVLRNIRRVEEKFPILKNQDRTLIALALVRERIGKKEEALAILDNELPKVVVTKWAREAADKIRAKIKGTDQPGANAPSHKKPSDKKPNAPKIPIPKPPKPELPVIN